jgi:hypothetical protein
MTSARLIELASKLRDPDPGIRARAAKALESGGDIAC